MSSLPDPSVTDRDAPASPLRTPQAEPSFIEIYVEARVQMRVSDLWPDGDAPAAVTAAAIKALMESQGSMPRVLDDWCLTQHAEVTVQVVNGGNREVEWVWQ